MFAVRRRRRRIIVIIIIIRITWHPGYYDHTSYIYFLLVIRIRYVILNVVFHRIPVRMGRVRCFPGSVEARFTLTVPDNYTSDATEMIKANIQNGMLGDLPVQESDVIGTNATTCADSPCDVNATCSDLEDGEYNCSCAPGFTTLDRDCKGACVRAPCGVTTTCDVEQSNCSCQTGFTLVGQQCQGLVRVYVQILLETKQEIENKSSSGYQIFVNNVTQELTQAFKDSPNFTKVLIVNADIRSGKIKVDFQVVYSSETPTAKTNEVKKVVTILSADAQDGSIQKLEFVPNGIVIRDAPCPPTKLTASNVTSSQILVKWTPPELQAVSSYVVSYHPVDNTSTVAMMTVNATDYPSVLLNNLKSDTVYKIFVRAVNEYGKSENSESIQVEATTKTSDDDTTTLIAAIAGSVAAIVLLFGVVLLIVCCILTRDKEYGQTKKRRGYPVMTTVALPYRDRPYPGDWSENLGYDDVIVESGSGVTPIVQDKWEKYFDDMEVDSAI